MFGNNGTEVLRSSRTTTPKPQYVYVPRRPQVVKMRDLSPASRARVAAEYYQTYDAMTGVRIAATLGGLITLFALFLFYKSRCKPEKPPPTIDLDDINSQSYSDTSSGSDSSSSLPVAHGGFAPPPTPIHMPPERKRKATISISSVGSTASKEIPSTSQISSELVRPPSGHSVKTKIVRTCSKLSNDSLSSISSSTPTSAKSPCFLPDTIVTVEDYHNVASSSYVVPGRSSSNIPPFIPHMVVVKCQGDKVVLSR